MNQNNLLNNTFNSFKPFLMTIVCFFVTILMSTATFGATLDTAFVFVFAPATTLCIDLRNACAQLGV